jgi:hypothetical protein
MPAHTYQRLSISNSSPADGTSTKAFTDTINILGSYAPGWTIVRTRLFLELSVVTYITTSAHRQLDVNWWVNTFPVAGLNFDQTNTGFGSSPLNPTSSARWLIIDGMNGFVDFTGVDGNGNALLTYKWTFRAGTENSFGQLKLPNPRAGNVYLCWDFVDPGNLINRSHLSFLQAYDLGATWHVDAWLQSPPA